MHWYSYNDAVPWLNKAKVVCFDLQRALKNSKIASISSACHLPACLPAVRPGCARCMAPEISGSQGNGGGFTNLLYRLRFVHCAIVFTLFFSILQTRWELAKEGVNNTLPLVLLRHGFPRDFAREFYRSAKTCTVRREWTCAVVKESLSSLLIYCQRISIAIIIVSVCINLTSLNSLICRIFAR